MLVDLHLSFTKSLCFSDCLSLHLSDLFLNCFCFNSSIGLPFEGSFHRHQRQFYFHLQGHLEQQHSRHHRPEEVKYHCLQLRYFVKGHQRHEVNYQCVLMTAVSYDSRFSMHCFSLTFPHLRQTFVAMDPKVVEQYLMYFHFLILTCPLSSCTLRGSLQNLYQTGGYSFHRQDLEHLRQYSFQDLKKYAS